MLSRFLNHDGSLDADWVGVDLRSRAYLAYVRKFPNHPAKIRLARILSKALLRGDILVKHRLGSRIHVDPNDYIGYTICNSGAYERRSIDLAIQIMRNGGLFVDVGSNFGVFSFSVGALPGVTCLAVDAASKAICQLIANAELNPHVKITIVNVALNDQQGLVALELPFADNEGTMRISKATARNLHVRNWVGAMQLSGVLGSLDMGPIKLMKVDVEGVEMEVMSGLDFTGRFRQENIIVEHTHFLPEAASRLAKLWEFLRARGYEAKTVEGKPVSLDQPAPDLNLWWKAKDT
jgi:FkbM family methyltransferase